MPTSPPGKTAKTPRRQGPRAAVRQALGLVGSRGRAFLAGRSRHASGALGQGMRRAGSGRVSKRTLAFLSALLLLATLFTAPWWWPWMLWRRATTSFVTVGPGFDSLTLRAIKADGPVARSLIPAIIHQTWKDENIPPEWQGAQQACKDLHPSWEYRLWTDNSSHALIAEKYPDLLRTFERYPYNIERADVIRYAVLAEYGGFYVDLDIQCTRPLDFLRQYPLVLPATRPVGFSNDFLAAAPHHPLMLQMLAALPAWNLPLITKYPTVMFSTGPMFVTLQASTFRNRAALWVLPDGMYGKYTHNSDAIFEHLYGSSWHGADARSVLWFVKHPAFLAASGAVLALSAVCTLWLAWRRRKRRCAARYVSVVELIVEPVKSA